MRWERGEERNIDEQRLQRNEYGLEGIGLTTRYCSSIPTWVQVPNLRYFARAFVYCHFSRRWWRDNVYPRKSPEDLR